MISIIKPEWPVPSRVLAGTTTRHGGYSKTPFSHFNLGHNTGESQDIIQLNRKLLQDTFCLHAEPLWLNQQHQSLVVNAAKPTTLEADGSYLHIKDSQQTLCAILTADCLPILLCSEDGTEIAALHAGWRGLLSGVIPAGLQHFQNKPENILAWLGPAIGPKYFEVGQEVLDLFIYKNEQDRSAFKQITLNKYLANIFQLAINQLHALGIQKIYGGTYCTYSDKEKFYSYRRDKGQTGRMATFIGICEKVRIA